MEVNNDNNFTIQIDFGGGQVEATVLSSLINNDTTALYLILVSGVKIAELQMDLSKTQWISKYGSLDDETIQAIGAKIEDYFD